MREREEIMRKRERAGIWHERERVRKGIQCERKKEYSA